jgi:CIC family chloride channel protein
VVGLLLQYVTPQARGSGIPQVKLDLAMRGGQIPFQVALSKLVTTAIAVGSGGSIGREGPTVQMCASLGSAIARWFPMTTAQLRIMVHAACVSGLAAAFNTPIAGVTFIMEEVIGDLAVYDVTMESSFRHPPHQQFFKCKTMIGETLKHCR